MKTPQKYEIEIFQQLLNIATEENYQNLSIDLVKWLGYMTKVFVEYRKRRPEQTKGKTNSELAICTFIWIDDGKNDMNGVQLHNTTTGEVTYKPFKKGK